MLKCSTAFVPADTLTLISYFIIAEAIETACAKTTAHQPLVSIVWGALAYEKK